MDMKHGEITTLEIIFNDLSYAVNMIGLIQFYAKKITHWEK